MVNAATNASSCGHIALITPRDRIGRSRIKPAITGSSTWNAGRVRHNRPSATPVVTKPDGRPLVHLRSDLSGQPLTLRPGANRLRVVVDDMSLAGGAYSMWARVVGLDANAPVILDSPKLVLNVIGGTPTAAIVAPRHRFSDPIAHEIVNSGAGQ